MLPEETLDPENWDEMRKLGHQMLDDMFEYLITIRKRPVWQEIPNDIKSSLKTSVPKKGSEIKKIYEEFKKNILPYPLGNIHPRFWGWVVGTGTPFAVLANLLTSTMNSNPTGGNQIANYVETQVIDWTKEMIGYHPNASGLLVSGCSMANLIGLAVARNIKAGYDVIKKGVRSDEKKLLVYGSTELHSSIDKAIQLLGLGIDSLRKIPVKDDYKIDIGKLRETLEFDTNLGSRPICIIGSAGTVNTGAVDDLNALANLAQEYDTMFHVDGAFGTWCKLSPKSAHLVDGIEKADSIAFDYHKWMYMQYDVGCVLIRDRGDHYQTFNLADNHEYMVHLARGIGSGDIWFSDYGVQMSREDRALKIWMCLKEHGSDKYGRLIEQNIQQANYLANLVKVQSKLELLAPTTMNIVNFRYNDGQMDNSILNKLNEEVLLQIQEKGVAAPSSTTLNNKFSIRVAITNHRSKQEDFDLLISEVLTTAESIEMN